MGPEGKCAFVRLHPETGEMVETGETNAIDPLFNFLMEGLQKGAEQGLLRLPDCLFPVTVHDNSVL